MVKKILAGLFILGFIVTTALATEWKTRYNSHTRKQDWVRGDDPEFTGTIHWTNFDPEVYTKNEVNDIVEGNTFDFFLNDTLSGIGAPEYFTIDPTETGEGESTFPDTITNDAFLIDSFITIASQPTFIDLIQGIYSLHIHAETTTGVGVKTVRLYWELYKRLADSPFTETLLLTSEESDILTNSSVEYDMHGVLSAGVVLGETDILLVKIYANIEDGDPPRNTDPLVTFKAEGTTASHFEVVTNVTAFDTRYILQRGDTTGAMTSDLNMDDGTLVISFDDDRVGIGTTNPQATLDVTGDLITSGDITIFNPTPILVFKDSNSSGAASVGFIEWRDSGGGRAGFLGNSSSGNSDLLWKNEQGGNIGIQTTGAGEVYILANVGIGTTNPQVALDVVGDITATNIVATNLTGTLQTAAQGNITSLGTLTNLQVDNININGDTIQNNAGSLSLRAENFDVDIFSGGNIYLDTSNFVDVNVNLKVGGEIDLGTNTIDDGQMTGDWDFSSGNLRTGGNIGIGTDPIADLHIEYSNPSGNPALYPNIRLRNNSTGEFGSFAEVDIVGGNGAIVASLTADGTGFRRGDEPNFGIRVISNSPLLFFTNAIIRATIEADGKYRIFDSLMVGSDADPSVTLDVVGQFKLTGDNNNCIITIDDDATCDAGTKIGEDNSIAICAVCVAN